MPPRFEKRAAQFLPAQRKHRRPKKPGGGNLLLFYEYTQSHRLTKKSICRFNSRMSQSVAGIEFCVASTAIHRT
jgi:hypothetical protein